MSGAGRRHPNTARSRVAASTPTPGVALLRVQTVHCTVTLLFREGGIGPCPTLDSKGPPMCVSRIMLLLTVLALVLPTHGVHAQDSVSVTSPAALQQALQDMTQGGEIVLSGGDYGALTLRSFAAPAQTPLVLRAADSANPPRIARMDLRDVQNVTLDGILFDYTFDAQDKSYLRPFGITSSTGITIRNAVFDGDVARGRGPTDNGFGTAFGFSVTASSHIALQNSEIRGFYRGLVISDSQGITVQGNDVHDIRMDGMNFSQVESVLIAGNRIHDFKRSLDSKDHADMIQFWTNGTTAPSRHIVIRDNTLNSGQGAYTQSIFMRNDLVDRGLAGREMFYSDVTIADNVIINAHLHGITVGETDGLRIQNNTVVRNARSEGEKDNIALWVPQIRVAETSKDVQIRRNVTGKLTGAAGQSDWTVGENLIVQDRARMEPGFYGTVFGMQALRDPTNPASFIAAKGGPLDGTQIGAPQLSR
ncbi:right-handed parallel beta-helix repeat-containing protein [Loktanella sp. M215]|uniref:right-handed parallel beta-helix repeat-containing protein n=1 Tax=Loktanella sp. M215 TaxID=2675431 RepID=UPI001F2372B5|nr:right-handed parallel beta-helix repeat-containing protein [Loktanella sp. M215]MCF7702207.1 hypothetical protein [Loktanella sp. M215]